MQLERSWETERKHGGIYNTAADSGERCGQDIWGPSCIQQNVRFIIASSATLRIIEILRYLIPDFAPAMALWFVGAKGLIVRRMHLLREWRLSAIRFLYPKQYSSPFHQAPDLPHRRDYES